MREERSSPRGWRGPGPRAWWPAMLLMAFAGAAAPAVELVAAEPIAHYRGGIVTSTQYRAWLELWAIEASSARRAALVGQLLLADQLEREGLGTDVAESPAFAFALRYAEERALRFAYGRAVTDAVQLPDETVAAYVEAHPELLARPRKVRLQNIFKRYPPRAGLRERQAVREELEVIRRRLLAGADFVALALEVSDSQTRYRKASIGNIGAGELPPELDRVAMALEPGAISLPLETPDGVTLLRAESVLPAYRPTVEAQRQQARETLLHQQRQQAWAAARQELEQRPGVYRNLELIADPATPDSAVVLAYTGGSLTRGELRELLQVRAIDGALEHQPAPRLERILDDYLLVATAAVAARAGGLDVATEVATARERRRSELLVGEAMRRRVAAQFAPLEPAEIESYFEQHRQYFTRLERYRLEAIRTPLDRETAREDLARVQAIVDALRSGELTFAAAARSHSDLASASAGGVVGWLTSEQLAGVGPRLLRAVELNPQGEVIGPVRQDATLWILKVVGFEPARQKSFSEARAGAERRLGNERVRDLQAAIEAELIADFGITID